MLISLCLMFRCLGFNVIGFVCCLMIVWLLVVWFDFGVCSFCWFCFSVALGLGSFVDMYC